MSWPLSEAVAGGRGAELVAAGGRRRSETVGWVPPSSVHSISSAVMPVLGEFGDAEAKGGPPVIDRFAEGQGLADRDPLGVLGVGFVGARIAPKQ